mgnify:CR=1 FL=1
MKKFILLIFISAFGFSQEGLPHCGYDFTTYLVANPIDSATKKIINDLQITLVDAQGNESISGTMELFWLYFPHCRFVFNNYFSYNDKNDAQWMSFDDLFWKRRFTSFIYKESNGFDRKIETYRSGVDALRESERIKEEIRTFEHDVWDY